MEVFEILPGYESENNCCPFCGFVENTPPEYSSYLPPGTELDGRYTVGTVIGAGGFGITYRAWDNVLNTSVAIKEYYPQGIVSRTGTTNVSIYNKQEVSYNHGRSRFLKEARSLAQLNGNPRTVNVHGFFEENNTAYIVMEYLKGCNLKEYVQDSNNTLSYELICKMADNMCDALKDVHAAGLIHRDISLDNIFLCNDGTFKLIDFGAVKQSLTDSNLSETVVLKHGYAPVEQYSKSGNIGPWTDIYALSATIYRLCTGKVPQESIDRLSSDNVLPPKMINNNLPRNFSNAVMKGMAVQITDRYHKIEDFKRDLFRSDMEPLPVEPVQRIIPVQPVPPISPPEPEPSGTNLVPIILIPLITIIILAAVFIYIFVIRDNDTGTTETETTAEVTTEETEEESTEKTTKAATEATTEAATEATTQADTHYQISEIYANETEGDNESNTDSFRYGAKWIHFYWKLEKAPDKIKYKVEVDYNASETQRMTGEQTLSGEVSKGSIQEFTVYGNTQSDPKELYPGPVTIRVYNAETNEYLGSKTVTVYE